MHIVNINSLSTTQMYADHSRWSKVKRLLIGQTISNDSRPEMERPEEI